MGLTKLVAEYEGGNRPKIPLGSHTAKYLAEQNTNQKVDMNAEKYFLGSSYRSNKSYMR